MEWKETIKLRVGFHELKREPGGVRRFSAREQVEVFCVGEGGVLHQTGIKVGLTNAKYIAVATVSIFSFLSLF
jgi:hypothetical protein